ncbi:TPA: hypothetical protein L4I55_002667 [Pseudomonas aeruginosa]|nr:hypothetical protein [Pseudomonas aeruginosa]
MARNHLHLVAQSTKKEIELSPRFRGFHKGFSLPGVEFGVDARWAGACAVGFLMDGTRHLDILPSVSEAQLVAGLLGAPIVGAGDIRILASERVEGSYNSAVEWGRVRLDEKVLRDVLSWWGL